jgi:hypothetical protein
MLVTAAVILAWAAHGAATNQMAPETPRGAIVAPVPSPQPNQPAPAAPPSPPPAGPAAPAQLAAPTP